MPKGENELELPKSTPPKLQIDDIRQQGYIVILKGKTEPNVTLMINDEKKAVEPDGRFTAFCNWEEIMNIDVFDSYGNITTKKMTIQQPR